VVVNFGTPAEARLAVGSLLASERPVDRVFLVDHDVPSHLTASDFGGDQRVVCLPQARNLGFAGGVNVGVRAALADSADAVFLLNSDARPDPDCLGRLDEALRPSPHVGIVAPLVLDRARPDLVASHGIDYDVRSGRMRERHAGQPRASVDTLGGDRTAVSGCAMLVARAAWERAGLFDERYFFGFEDIDFCLRVRAAGLAVRLVGDAVTRHACGGTLAPTAPRRFYFAARNHLLLAHDHHEGGWAARVARAPFVVALNLAHAVTAPGGSALGQLQATLRGAADYAAGRFGPAPF
jgi:GT2 family glycosyltransferase